MMHHHPCSHMGVCSCGLFQNQSSNSFSMIFSSYEDAAPAAAGATTSSVDCTLSLATPSTRISDDDDKRRRSYVPNFCWDLLQCGQNVPTTSTGGQPPKTTARPAGNGGDHLLARRCANCDTTSTPLWRNGPRGPKSLCNACGIRFKKEERRANANSGSTVPGTAAFMDHHQQQTAGVYSSSSWVQPQKMQCYSPANEFRFMEDNDGGADGVPFLSWRLNVTDYPASLVHDFTR